MSVADVDTSHVMAILEPLWRTYTQMPVFMARLGEVPGESARALEFAIHTAARSNEVRGARWSEFDLAAKS